MTYLLIAAILLLVLGIYSKRSAKKKYDPLEEYEFQNRTDGGCMGFDSLAKSKIHKKKKLRAALQQTFGAILTTLSIIMFVIYFVISGLNYAHESRMFYVSTQAVLTGDIFCLA
ncbi:MAG: hypothetical protein HOM14_15600, partial [Gammaproteobacteria bacterium]|nr:hypothetical protein [Gammaproteobacteria bacterium]MBT6552772.1 hypothetical protein [Gammaproteobacteria bacterium]